MSSLLSALGVFDEKLAKVLAHPHPLLSSSSDMGMGRGFSSSTSPSRRLPWVWGYLGADADVDVDALGFGLCLSSSISIASPSEALFNFGLGLGFAILSLSSSYASLASAVEAGSCCGIVRLHRCWALALSTRVVSGRSLEEQGNDEPRPELWFIFMTYQLGLPLLGPPCISPASEPAHITLGRGGPGLSGEFAVGPLGASSLNGRDA